MKLIHASVLLTVLLAGCNLPHSRTANSDARQFVDAQILTHQQAIEVAHNTLTTASIEIRSLPEGKWLSAAPSQGTSSATAPRNPFSGGRKEP